MKAKLLLFLSILSFSMAMQAEDIVKKGFNFGALPAVSYNTDMGFQYGALVNVFHYGDGSRYPAYDHSLYVEASKYTKGTGVLRMYYDSDCLIRGVRSFVDISYVANKMQDFYGFNGYQSLYDETKESAFYRMNQKKLHVMADFRGDIYQHLKWLAGYGFYDYRISSVNIDDLNENRTEDNKIPNESLYQKYVDWGLIDADQANGGVLNLIKAGVMYDTRNAKTNPDKGMFTEALLEVALPGLNQTPYTSYIIMHRQYVRLIEKRLNLAVRVGAQGFIGNNVAPFYRKPQLISTFATRTVTTGLGGNSTLRGILQNRVVGDGFAMANVELRWKMVKFNVGKQNFYVGTNFFWDGGYIYDPVDVDYSLVPLVDRTNYFTEEDGLHHAVGLGLKIAMNENFVVSADVGKAFNKQDHAGTGVYIGLNYLY